MKKTFVFAALALCAAALAVSCEKKDFDQPVEKKGEMVTFTVQLPSADSKVDIDGQGKVTWEVGDKIHIHTGHIRSGETATVELTADDISSDGKSATISFEALTPYDYSSWGDGYAVYYAAYPADATSNPESCYSRNFFSNTNDFLMAACDNEGVFQFKNLCGVIAFEVTGSFDSYVFSGNNDETVGYDSYAVEILRTKQNYSYYNKDKDLGTKGEKTVITGDLKPGVNYICLPNGTNFSGGFSIKFKDGEDIVKIAKTTTGVDVARNKFLNLGDITSKLEDYVAPTSSDHKSTIADATDLSAGGTAAANCYVISAPGAYMFPVVKGNSNQSAGNVFGVELLWETYNNAEDVTANSVIAAVDFDGPDNYVYFMTPETLKPGNALIAAKNSEGAIIWSWHIWVPQTAIVTENYGILAQPMMDRNLGALVAATADAVAPVESFGLTYQWGRKDPFPGPAAANSNDNAKVAGKQVSQTPGAGDADECKITLEQAIANPTLLGHSKNGDWINPLTNKLWTDSGKTIYDPCPAGYRVPARDKAQPFHSNDLSTATGWSESTTNFVFTLGNPLGVFPFAGYRDDYGPKSMSYASSRAAYWTAYASTDAVKGYYVNVRAGSTHALGEVGKSRGCSVRCVVE